MRLTLIARADNTGLGNQTWELYCNLKPTKTYVIDLNNINSTLGKKTKLHMERFPDATVIDGFPTHEQCVEILKDTDVLMTVETPYNYDLFALAKEMGVKTVLQYNYEFLDYLQNPALPLPDVLLAPSRWHLEEVVERFKKQAYVLYLPVPTNRTFLRFKPRKKAETFIHVAGHPTYKDRNGTLALLEALQYVKSPIKLKVYSQHELTVPDDPRIALVDIDFDNYWEIYNKPDQDVLILPRRYGGLSLQMNEAMSVGMPVLATGVEPQADFLPMALQIPPEYDEPIETRTIINCYHPSPFDIAERIDYLYKHPNVVARLSYKMDELITPQSWEHMKPKYLELLETLCQN